MLQIKQIQKDLKDSYASTDIDETYGLLIDVGKNLNLTKSERETVKDDIAKYLQHSHEELRSAAIRVLAFYWAMPEYREHAMKMFQEEENEQTRSVALMAWGSTYYKTNNKKSLNFLYEILKDNRLDEMIRSQAYGSIFSVSPLEPKDWPKINLNLYEEDFDKQINWELVEEIVKNAVA